jgi:hypothetical protein
MGMDGFAPVGPFVRIRTRPVAAGAVALTDRVVGGEGVEMKRRRHLALSVPELSVFAGDWFAPEVILLAGVLVSAVRVVVARSRGTPR